MHIGRLFLLPLLYRPGCVSSLDFPFFYWDEEVEEKGRKQTKQAFTCLPLSVTQNSCMCFGGERKLKLISRQLIIPYQTALRRSCETNCLCQPSANSSSLSSSPGPADTHSKAQARPSTTCQEGTFFCQSGIGFVFLGISWTWGVTVMLCWKPRFQGEFPYTMDCI